jgi:hypothetical protein
MKTVSDLLSETDWEDAVDDSLKTIAESNTEMVPNDNGTMDENLNPIDEDQDPFHGFESPGAAPHSQDMEQIHESPLHLRPKRISKQPKRLIEDPNFLSICDSALISSDFVEPTSYQEASLSPQAEEWKTAMQEEIDSLATHGTWRLEKLPDDRRTIQNKWVYKVKRDAEGNSTRFKARLVAKGFSQREGIDYGETFAPVVRHESVRTIFAVAAARDLEIMQLDVKTAFLYGDLIEEIYMDQPEGFRSLSQPTDVCRLQKSLYGLKQASRSWNETFDGFLVKFGFIRSNADSCVYFRENDNGVLILAIWVDDGLLCGTSKQMLAEVVNYLRDQLEITSEAANHFIGLKIERNRPSLAITLSQEQYVLRMLDRFGMTNCNSKTVPADPFTDLMAIDLQSEGSQEFDQSIYREAVGSIMYLMVCTRPYIAFAVGKVAQHCNKPKMAHWTAVKRIMAYLKGTASHGISYHATGFPDLLLSYSDSDYAGDLQSRRSTSCYLLMFHGGIITWASRRQSYVSLSTTEAEYVAMCEATKEVTWMRRLLSSIGATQLNPTKFLCDNQGVITKNSQN